MRRYTVMMTGAVLAWLCFAAEVESQSAGSVRGRVTSDEGRPLSGAQLSLAGTSRGTITGEQGQYLLVNVPAGTYTLEVRLIGYGPERATVRVAAGAAAEQNFVLRQEAVGVERVVVSVGSRAAHTAANELAVPVDVFPKAEIGATSRLEMSEVIQELSPAVNFPRPQIADITSGVRPFQLRGLSPDHALVLVNGKRRHPTAVVHVFGGAALTSGSSGVDMNAIPSMALEQVEILRDGAAAQYGSDAIAGVINVGLKSSISAPAFTVTVGEHAPREYERDGRRWDVAGNWGLPIGRGVLNLTAQVSDRQKTDRGCPDPRDQVQVGDADVVRNCKVVEKRNPVPQPNHLWGDGEFRNYILFWNAQYPLAADEQGSELYLFGGVSRRADLHSGYYRRSLDNRNWPQIHPLGFLPTFSSVTRDAMAVAGVRGELAQWRWDLSGQVGHNRVDNDIVNTLNVSLGPCMDRPCAPGRDGVLGTADDPGIPNKTEFYAGSLELNQLVADLDFTRTYELGLPKPLNVALGATVRADNYRLVAGEPGSYVNGYHPNRRGGIAASGSQVFPGYRPEQEADAWRSNVGVYADVEANLTSRFLMAGAARLENYSDFGATLTGKVAARYQPMQQLILRAAASTGFRAPALSQTYYAHTSTGFRNDGTGNQIAYEIGEFPINSPEARALGAQPLREERSRNLSAGVAITPVQGLNLTADYYYIEMDDRIVLSNALQVNDRTPEGRRVKQLLSGYQAEAVKYFTNALSTETWGLDVTASYRHLFGQNQLWETVLAYNFTGNRVVGDVITPEVLAGMGTTLFPMESRIALEKGRPRDRANFKTRYTQGPIRTQVGANYYGEITTLLQEIPTMILHEYPARTVWDAEVSYKLPRGVELAVGAENILDTFPEPIPDGYNFLGIFRYSGAGFGYNGRFLYTRMSVNF